MQSFALSRGVSTAGGFTLDSSWSGYKTGINNYGPNIIYLRGQTYYCDGDPNKAHVVTGVGWREFSYNGSSVGHQYMEIHDKWWNTAMTVYVAYGRNYDYILFAQFSPR
ncbi:hypothetical protein Dtox_3148 [Desulfofarcimen acetoxidans DSM 771]|uniref:Uncharacterized protein n=1 Tax=Desulfofarcimen acetoxidans (strain ATCC 49208 / DSM 771 / KCTC 5769 / VKM B-1644 / 5575) TaxID=485916 RepID=C8W4K7_DESAS|nr:hypothetical protein [Desulfofarcimen acetoxidans]ACV63893.1 hypothetical protein Dtox_3148 [Desulfofarcimen acetoxidans DSM 771]